MILKTSTLFISAIPFFVGKCARNIDPLLDNLGSWGKKRDGQNL